MAPWPAEAASFSAKPGICVFIPNREPRIAVVPVRNKMNGKAAEEHETNEAP
jgi:hypothetical protein